MSYHEADAASRKPLIARRDQKHIAEPARGKRDNEKNGNFICRSDIIGNDKKEQKRLGIFSLFRIILPGMNEVDHTADGEKNKKYDA